MSLEETVEHLLVAERKLSAHDTRVVHTEDGVDVLHTLRPDVGELFDLRCRVLDLLVGHLQAELLHPRLNRVPACEPVATRNVCTNTSISISIGISIGISGEM